MTDVTGVGIRVPKTLKFQQYQGERIATTSVRTGFAMTWMVLCLHFELIRKDELFSEQGTGVEPA